MWNMYKALAPQQMRRADHHISCNLRCQIWPGHRRHLLCHQPCYLTATSGRPDGMQPRSRTIFSDWGPSRHLVHAAWETTGDDGLPNPVLNSDGRASFNLQPFSTCRPIMERSQHSIVFFHHAAHYTAVHITPSGLGLQDPSCLTNMG
jgi:hypothetical protein